VAPGTVIGGVVVTEILGPISLSKHGDVVFLATGTGGAVLTQSSLIAKPGTQIAGRTLVSASMPTMNEDGEIAFWGGFESSSGFASGIFTSDGQLLLRTGQTIRGRTVFALFNDLAFGKDRRFVAIGQSEAGPTLFGSNAVLAEAGQVIAGKTLVNFGDVAINKKGEYAFVAYLPDIPAFPSPIPQTAVFVDNRLIAASGTVLTDATTSTTFPITNIGGVDIGEKGNVVYLATILSRSNASVIATGTQIVFRSGTQVGGKTVLQMGVPVVDREGKIAFSVIFNDFTSGIVVAAP
jgi:hypothetical protein